MAVVREVTAAPSHFAAHISRGPVTAVLTARLSPPCFTRPAPLFALMACGNVSIGIWQKRKQIDTGEADDKCLYAAPNT